ncbi:hypothetical protein LINPERPRIM_LOCUS19255, partial [Linum perenne]
LWQSEDEIIDCVDIYKQPSLNNPLLKNHTLQLKRNRYPNELETKESVNSSEHTQMWHNKEEYCPEGTVAILRTSITKLPPKKSSNCMTSNYSILYLPASAMINLWKPRVVSNEHSASQIWVTDGAKQKFESIEAGWLVNILFSKLYQFFGVQYDGYYKTGCYNLQCPGFVQTSPRVVLGGRINGPISTYGGEQRIVTIQIIKDFKTSNWWLYYQGVEVGYWPGDLFTNLKKSASLLQWGGEVINKKANGFHTRTQMGSGHFPSEGFHKAAYFRSLIYFDENGDVQGAFGIRGHVTRPKCYDIDVKKPVERLGVRFFYGGPGFSPHCVY